MPNLKGRKKGSGSDREAESDEEFDFGTIEEVEDGYGGSNRKREPKLESTEPRGSRAAKGGNGSKVGKSKADQMKAKTKTWSVVVKGLKIEDELETTNLDKSGNESEIDDSVRMFDSETPNHLDAKQKKGQRKRRQQRDNKETN